MKGFLLALCISVLLLAFFLVTPELVRSQTTLTPTENNEPYPGPATSTSVFSTSTPATQQPAPTFTKPSNEITNQPPDITAGTTSIATATLIPLPELHIIFPTVVVAEANEQASENLPGRIEGASWFTWERLLFLFIILLIWLLLGAWFYFSLRRLE